MKNKQLQELLSQYPNDEEVIVHCANYHFGNAYQYPLTGVNLVNRKYELEFNFKKTMHDSSFIELTGHAE